MLRLRKNKTPLIFINSLDGSFTECQNKNAANMRKRRCFREKAFVVDFILKIPPTAQNIRKREVKLMSNPKEIQQTSKTQKVFVICIFQYIPSKE